MSIHLVRTIIVKELTETLRGSRVLTDAFLRQVGREAVTSGMVATS